MSSYKCVLTNASYYRPATCDYTSTYDTYDNKWGEVVTACVAGENLSAIDLDRAVQASGLAAFKRPRRYLFVDSLPRNAANKVLRRRLKSLAETSVLQEI